ncbi:MAG: hypothetical protein BGO89_02345 [Candidatus Kapaibacterium thiocyanatum]|uniref:OmpA-like domain-containing protein n=1 Tax=Candidatus Kapaibacterium thiocyanatum TaxID=1895771 RepID=A0A1M3L238_9BACT|nr:MAG: hypothetical protein BGO89_02345 ['Candidatus Kapabacteria' thiocyanatum]
MNIETMMDRIRMRHAKQDGRNVTGHLHVRFDDRSLPYCAGTFLRIVMTGLVLCVSLPATNGIAQGPTTCMRQRLPESINKFQPTTIPVLSPDGQTLFVDRKLHPENEEGASDPDDVWISHRMGGSIWTEPERTAFTTFRRPDVLFSLSRDGRRALVYGRYLYRDGDSIRCFAVAERIDAGLPFSVLTPIDLPAMRDMGRNFYGSLSDDATALVIAMNRPGGVGDLDLYVSRRCGDKWSTPVSLGHTINTKAFEGAPCLAPDGLTLYFSSSGRDDRRGKADMYVTRRLDDTWTSWSRPVNMGPCINTLEDETSFSLIGDGDSALVTSWDPEHGRPGIYLVGLTTDQRPAPYVMFSGRITNPLTGQPVEGARLVVRDSTSTCREALIYGTGANGDFTITLASGKRYGIEAQAAHHISATQTIGVRRLDSTSELRLSVYLFDHRMPLASVFFERGSYEVGPVEQAKLDELVQRYGLRAISFEVVGYTDPIGNQRDNARLSKGRAEATREALRKAGADEKRIEATGRGVEYQGTQLFLKEHPQSRRVDIFPAQPPGRGQ